MSNDSGYVVKGFAVQLPAAGQLPTKKEAPMSTKNPSLRNGNGLIADEVVAGLDANASYETVAAAYAASDTRVAVDRSASDEETHRLDVGGEHVDKIAKAILAKRGVERPDYRQYSAAACEAAVLLEQAARRRS